jgi:hypothetical protein
MRLIMQTLCLGRGCLVRIARSNTPTDIPRDVKPHLHTLDTCKSAELTLQIGARVLTYPGKSTGSLHDHKLPIIHSRVFEKV